MPGRLLLTLLSAELVDAGVTVAISASFVRLAKRLLAVADVEGR